jgi:hypothetical protein
MNGYRNERLKRIRSELQSAYTLLEQIESSGTLAEKKLDLWRARCRLELAILLIKISSGIDYEDRRVRYTAEGGLRNTLAKAREFVADALNSTQSTDAFEVLEKVRKARDLLWMLEAKSF